MNSNSQIKNAIPGDQSKRFEATVAGELACWSPKTLKGNESTKTTESSKADCAASAQAHDQLPQVHMRRIIAKQQQSAAT